MQPATLRPGLTRTASFSLFLFALLVALLASSQSLLARHEPHATPAAANAACDPNDCPEEAVFPVPQGGERGAPILAKPGEIVCIDIRVEQNPFVVLSYGYTVQFDPTRLTLLSTQRGPLVQNFIAADCSQPQPGMLSCFGFNTVGIPANSSGVLATLCFMSLCPPGTTSDTTIVTVTNLQDDFTGMAGCCNFVICSNPQPGACDGPAIGFAAPGAEFNAPIFTKSGELVEVEVRLNDLTQAVDAFGFNVNYDAARLSFVRAERGELLSTFFAAECRPDAAGTLVCSGGNNVAIPARQNGVLFRLFFNANGAIGDSSLLTIDALRDDLSGISACKNHVIYEGCDLLDCSGPSLYLAPTGGQLGDILSEQRGDTLMVDVRVQQNPRAISAFGHRLRYNPDHLKFVDASSGNLTASFVAATARELQPGTLVCAGFGASAVPANSEGALLKLRFAVTANAGDSSALKITDLVDDLEGLNVCCSYFIGAPCDHDGDVNSDKKLTAGDAFCAFETFLNGGILAPSCDLPEFQCELLAADANCDNTITARDALAIFSRGLQALPPAECFARGSFGKFAAAPQIRIVRGENAGDMLRLRVEVAAAPALEAFGMLLQYPVQGLQFAGVERSSATQNWIALNGSQYLPGMVVIGGFHVEALTADAPLAMFDILFRHAGANIDNNTFAISSFTDDFNGAHVTFALDETAAAAAPRQFRLYQNYPNPVSVQNLVSGTVIRYDLPDRLGQTAAVELIIYNLQGQTVRRLFSGTQTPGTHKLAWDGRDDAGVQVPTGTYQYRLKAGEYVESKRVVVVK